jgi:hypothetical protein
LVPENEGMRQPQLCPANILECFPQLGLNGQDCHVESVELRQHLPQLRNIFALAPETRNLRLQTNDVLSVLFDLLFGLSQLVDKRLHGEPHTPPTGRTIYPTKRM